MTELSVKDAQDACDAAAERFESARLELLVANTELDNAKRRADELLPKAVMVTRIWGIDKDERTDVVIVKRTAARITVRHPGCSSETVFRLSKNKYNGTCRWVVSPPGKQTLEIAE